MTFDYLVLEGEKDPEVLHLNIFEMDDDDGAFARQHLRFEPNPADYTHKKVLAVPRCCQKPKGRRDRSRVNDLINWRTERHGENAHRIIKGSKKEN